MTSAKRKLQELIKKKKEQAATRITPAEREGDYNRLSFSQQRLWFLHDYMGPNAAYNIPLALRLKGDVDEKALLKAIRSIFLRHESLRTRLEPNNQNAIQVIQKLVPAFHVELVDSEIEMLNVESFEKNYQFDLTSELLCRIRVVKRTDAPVYGLFITMHHIISDGWSTGVFFQELVSLYQAFKNNLPSPLAPLNLQYVDFACWQRRWLKGEVLDKQIEFWKKQLSDVPHTIDIPTDFPRPKEQTFNGFKVPIEIPSFLTNKINEFSKSNGVTLYMTLLAAFGVLLRHYSNQTDLAIGTPIANRNRKEVEGLIGFFVNTLVMRLDLTRDPSFKTLLALTREMALNSYAHQDIPFERLIEEIKPERNTSHSPLFQVMFVLQNTPTTAIELPDIQIESFAGEQPGSTGEKCNARFDLTLNLQETSDGIVGTMEYNSDLFRTETIERLLQHYSQILQTVIENPEQKVSTLDIVLESEKKQQLDWNNTDAVYHDSVCVHELFEYQASKNPNAIAVNDLTEKWDYATLNSKANRLAHRLKEIGVKTDDRIAICLDRKAELIIGILAILKVGGCYVPLDSAYPNERLQFMLEQADCKVIIADSTGEEDVFWQNSDFSPSMVNVAAMDDSNYPDSNINTGTIGVTPQNLAYVIYTSGSTGEPKGVSITHQNITSLFSSDTPIEVNKDDNIAQLSSQSFDAITYELWGALTSGATLIMVGKDDSLNPDRLQEIISTHSISIIFLTTALFNRICYESPNCFNNVKKLLFGGEAFSSDSIDIALNSTLSELHHVYGPTETTTYATSCLLDNDTFKTLATAPIGRPLPNKTAFIISNGHLLPTGVIGELHIGGAGVARGYIENSRLTAKKFIPDFYSHKPGSRLYRTGDLVRYLHNGDIEFIGRIDHQVKIRGFRIEPGEVENTLSQLHYVKDAAVIVKTDDSANKRLIAYIVFVENQQEQSNKDKLEKTEIDIKQKLPEYMVPSAFVEMSELPLNINGKLDQTALPEPQDERGQMRYVAPQTQVEKVLVEVWQDKLKVENVGIQDNFFVLGGDSIRSISLVAEAKNYGLSFTVKDLFTYPTIKELAQFIEKSDNSEVEYEKNLPFALLTDSEYQLIKEEFTQDELQDAYPLSMMQQGMIIHTLKQKELSLYENIQVYSFDEPWDEVAFDEALSVIQERHPVLKSRCKMTVERPLQIIPNHSLPKINVFDLRLIEQPVSDVMANWMAEEKELGIDVAKMLWRGSVHVISETQFVFGIVMHHALMDGWSLESLAVELKAVYSQVRLKNSIVEDVKLPSFSEFIKLEQTAVSSKQQKDYWRNKTKSISLPWWTGRTKSTTTEFSCELKATTSNKFSALAIELNVQEKSIWCSVYLALIALLNASEKVTGTISTQGRPEIPGGEKTVGLFINALPISANISQVSWHDFICNVDEELRQQHEFRRYPIAEIQRISGNDFAASLFNYTNWHVYYEQNDSEASGDVDVRNSQTDKSLAFKVGGFRETNYLLYIDAFKDEKTGEFGLTVSADSNVFDSAFCERIRIYLSNIVQQIERSSEKIIDPEQLICVEERQQLIQSFCQSKTPRLNSVSVLDMFNKAVVEKADAIAAVYQNHSVSYYQLNQMVNGLASRLCEGRVEGGVPIGIYFERGVEMIAAMLAVLKSGNYYVPLDPEYPSERTAYIIDDSGLKLIVSNRKTTNSYSTLEEIININEKQEKNCFDVLFCDNDFSSSIEHDETVAFDWGISCLSSTAYSIYTSGSTGKPKGVKISHENAVNFLQSMKDSPGIYPSDRLLAVTTLSFDIALLELLLPLTVGACVEVADKQTVTDSDLLAQYISDKSITMMQATPVTWKLLLEGSWKQNLRLKALVGGEAVSPELVNALAPKVKSMWNMYGPTETTVWSAIKKLEGGELTVPIGKSIDNTQCYVLNPNTNLCPLGVPGELYIGGRGVAQGYQNQAAMTAERFIPSPFSKTSGQRLYKTGDLVRFLNSGELEFLGRLDQQIKIRGFRIETGEIEAQINRISYVKESAVVLSHDQKGESQLIAFITIDDQHIQSQISDGNSVDTALVEQVRSRLYQVIPTYMVPSKIVLLDELPLTENGKINKNSLMKRGASEKGYDFEEPINELEKQIADYWQTLLGCENVGRNDSFFGLGGHSLLATQLLSWIRANLNVELPIQVLFEKHTLAQLASEISKQLSSMKADSSQSNQFEKFSNLQKSIDNSSELVEEGEV